MNKRLGVFLILGILVLSMNFSSAGWFSNLVERFSGDGNTITGNFVAGSGKTAITVDTNYGQDEGVWFSGNPEIKWRFSGMDDISHWTRDFKWGSLPEKPTTNNGKTIKNGDVWTTNAPCGTNTLYGIVNTWETYHYISATYNRQCECTSFTYSNWSACVNGQQTRTVASSTPSGCTGGNPVLSQSCTSTCTSFTYSNWSACVDGQQTRKIVSSSPYGCVGGSPVLSQSCTISTPTCTDSDGGLNYYVRGTMNQNEDNCNTLYSGLLHESYCSDIPYTLDEIKNGPHDMFGSGTNANEGAATVNHFGYDISVVEVINRTRVVLSVNSVNFTFNLYEWKDFGGIAIFIDEISFGRYNIDSASFNVVSKYARLISYQCPNGCVDGACVNKTTTCTDSDGGLDVYTYGKTLFKLGLFEGENIDECALVSGYDSSGNPSSWMTDGYNFSCSGENCYIQEAYCAVDSDGSFFDSDAAKMIKCVGGCANGACVNTTMNSCESAVSFVKNPKNITLDGITWQVDYDSNYDSETQHYAVWKYEQNNEQSYVSTSVGILSDSSAVQNRLNMALENGICEQTRVYTNYDAEEYQVVYVCKNIWRIANQNQQVSQSNAWNYQNDVVAIWFNKGRLFNMEFSSYDYYDCYDDESCQRMETENHQRQQNDLIESIDKLINNKGEYTSVGYLDWRAEQFVKYFLKACPSEIEETEYQGSWSCKMEPAICPPHGEQTQICTRWNQMLEKEEKREATMQCSPGICSGCYVPRWFGNLGDNKCIPYGFRFEQQTGWTIKEVFVNDSDEDGLTVEDANKLDDVDLVVLSGDTAILSLEVSRGEYKNITIREGETYDWDEIMEDKENGLQYELFVDEIYLDSVNYEKSYIKVTFSTLGFIEQQMDNMINAYCDIDGNVKQQKTEAWGSCQNNYECESNLCSYGECVGLKEIANELQGFGGFLTRVLCRLSNLFSTENYEQCLVSNI